MNARTVLAALTLTISLPLIPGCAAGTWSAHATALGPGSDLLCASEVGATRFSTVFEAIQVLRPRFLQGRGPDSHAPVAYLDGARMSDLSFLRAMSTREMAQVRFLSAADATTRYGTGHPGGALLVSTVEAARGVCGR